MPETTQEQINLYTSLFKGRSDVFAKRWEKGNKSGYSPAYKFSWQEFMMHKSQGGTIHNFENKEQIPLTEEIIRNHLLGKYVVGVYPLLKDNTCNFIVADFDKKNWKAECRNFVRICKKYKIPAYTEISRSGKGAHVWIFFEKPYPAENVRAIIFEILRQTLKISEFQKEVSFDRVFPNQDLIPKGGFGNLIALPLNGKSVKKSTTIFVDNESLAPIKNQWEFLSKIKKIHVKQLDKLFNDIKGIGTEINKTNAKSPKSGKELQITLAEQLYLDKNQIPINLKQFLRDKLNFYNSEYLIKKRLGKSVYKIERFFNLISEKGGQILVPRGFMNELNDYCLENDIKLKITDKREKKPKVQFSENIKLHNYQQKAFNACTKKDFGVLVAPPGSGKTIIGLKLITEKQQPALILVHRKQLLDQWVERIQSFLKIPKNDIGIISGSKKKIGKKLTIGMIQSLVRLKDVSEYSDAFGTIIVDECHHIPAKSFRKTIIKFKSYYIYGLTATPKRKHNDEKLIFVYVGEILHQMDQDYKDEKELGDIQVIINETKLKLPFEFTIDNFQLLTKIIIFDTARNRLISKDIMKQVKKKSRVLVLTDRKDHVDVLNQYLKSKCETITLTGDDSASSKKSKIAQIQQGHFQVLISTGQLFGEGMDIKHLGCLVLAFPFSFEGKLIQYIGRIQRASGTKTILDYRDKDIEFLDRMFKNRNRYYKKLNEQKEKKH